MDSNSLGGCIPKYIWQFVTTLISVVLNSFIKNRLKVKSNDFMSDLGSSIDSKPYNNTGIHFEEIGCKITSSDAARPLDEPWPTGAAVIRQKYIRGMVLG